MPVLTKDVWEVSEQDFPDTAPIQTQLLEPCIHLPRCRGNRRCCGYNLNTVRRFAQLSECV